jgi:spore coat protein A, manganese oxidase
VRKFDVSLAVPAELSPSRSDSDADYYEIEQRVAHAIILPGLRTTIWGYNGVFPGPTIRARAGRKTIVRQTNRLAVPTVVHLHGGVTPSESDGFPTDLSVPDGFPANVPICSSLPSIDEMLRSGRSAPGNMKVHTYPNRQRAATLWYHDHAMDFTGRNVFMGLAGFYLIEDEEERALNVPSGVYDVPLMICVRRFAADGSFLYDDRSHLGAQGDVVLVNGAAWPRLEVERRKYRLRILNACNSTPLTLALDTDHDIVQIATDAGLLPAPVAVKQIPLAMAERAEVVIDFAKYRAGTRIVLQDRSAGGKARRRAKFRTHVLRCDRSAYGRY